MTNAEAKHHAVIILQTIATITEMLDEAHVRTLLELADLLEAVQANRLGITEPHEPLDYPWALHDGEIINTLRTSYLPRRTARAALTTDQLHAKFTPELQGESKIED